MLKILHKVSECIGCDACVEVAPHYFEMGEDGCAHLLEARGRHGPYVLGRGFEEDKDALNEAQEACPVQIIKIE